MLPAEILKTTVDDIYLRPLQEGDADISWRWRNDADVWQYTGSRPTQTITPEAERNWLTNALGRPDEKRFAICLRQTDEYIGNAQLTDISAYGAQLHLFIGERKYWGKGYGKQATLALLQIADSLLRLQVIFLLVHPQNAAAIKIYEAAGFVRIGNISKTQMLMERRKSSTSPLLSVFMMSYKHADFIGQALQGVFSQQVDFDMEIVLSDDASPDHTRVEIFKYYRQRPALFKLILPDANLGAAVNQWKVFDNCNGDYIALLEADDYWTHPHKLQKQVAYLQQHPETSICFHNCQIENYDTGEVEGFSNYEQDEISTLQQLSLTAYPYTPSVVFRAQYLRQFPQAHRRFMNNRTLDLYNAHFGNLKYFPEVMAVYRRHTGGSWSMVARTQTLFTQLPVYEFYLRTFDKRYEQQFRQNLLNMTNELLQRMEAEKNFKQWPHAVKWFLKHQPLSKATVLHVAKFIWKALFAS